jgi:SAM-dependent methyltransferase
VPRSNRLNGLLGAFPALLFAGCLAFTVPGSGNHRSEIAVAGFDSGTRVVREVAEALTGKGRSILECYPWGSELFLRLLGLFPPKTRIAVTEWGMRLSLGDDPAKAEQVDVGSLVQWCVDQYPADGRRYETILLGSPNGAVAHLAALLHTPFLTTSFGLTFRHAPMEADDLTTYLRGSEALIEEILHSNETPDFEIVSHYDPLHDRSLVKAVHFLRIKLRELPENYKEFIRRHLAPGGRLILIDCTYPWPQYVLSDRAFLQVGGLGGILPETFLERWPIEAPIEFRRESEWGSPEAFAASVRDYATLHEIELMEIRFDHPQDYSRLAYEAYRSCRGARPEAILIDCFNHQNPRTNVETGIPALWLPFNTVEGVSFVEEVLEGQAFDRIFFILLPSFAESPDTAALAPWIELLSRHGDVELVGIDPKRFPTDPVAPFRFARRMNTLRKTFKLDTPLHIDVKTLEVLVSAFDRSEDRPEPEYDSNE